VGRLLRRYFLIPVTLGVGMLGALLWLLGLPAAPLWILSAYSLAIAAVELVRMIARLRDGVFGIDVLAIIAIVATVAVGEYVASLIVVLMLTGGQALEDYAEGAAERELTKLLDREPREAHRLEANDDVRDIAVDEVAVGDRLLVRSGEVVPVDGILRSPANVFDQSSLTGESLPVEKRAGDPVLSGSVNGVVAATIEASALARDSQYQGIVALVKRARSERAPVVRLADRYAVPFTVVSLLIAGAAWIVSGDPRRFAEVLVLATPCPLLLAAPIAFLGGMSRAARHGVVVKNGGVLELLARAQTVVFDKTGTLTLGRPRITGVDARDGDADGLLTLVASAEQVSSHVLAESIVAEARARGLTLRPVLSSREAEAAGVSARLETASVDVGTLAFARRQDPTITAVAIAPGELAIYVVVDGRFAGTVRAADAARPEAPATVAELRRLGVGEIRMLTGDARATAEHVADLVGIQRVDAECLPGDKVAAVRLATARPVVMVGDGVNDAPALAAADVGIAMGARGATAASEAAGAVILTEDLRAVPGVVAIGRATVRIGLQSIWLGIALSLGLMVVATTGLIPATLGAGLQEVVDLLTILNALRAIGRRDTRRPEGT
jgi:heavy metal translocating P-type ATPase